MSTPSLPKLGTLPAPAPLRKIALEKHFGHPIVFMRDSDGRFHTRTRSGRSFLWEQQLLNQGGSNRR
jgi:hypothetical protein